MRFLNVMDVRKGHVRNDLGGGGLGVREKGGGLGIYPGMGQELEPKFLALAKMCLFIPFARMDLGGTLRDPILTLIFDHFGPLLRVLEGGCG